MSNQQKSLLENYVSGEIWQKVIFVKIPLTPLCGRANI